MCLTSSVFVVLLLFTCTKSNEDLSDHLNNAYAPPAVNFHEIFSNSISMLADDPTLTGTKEEDFHINIIPTQFVEFQTQPSDTTETTRIPTTTPPPPPPKYILNSSYLKKNISRTITSSSSTTTPLPETSTTETECHIQVIPIKKDTERQRGVLDLLFPASRVRTFKGVFDTFRRILSHTFRKR